MAPAGAEAGRASAVPPDHRTIVEEVVRLSASFAELVLPLSANQFHWQPASGKSWSVGQCVDHLTRTNRIYLPALAAAAEAGRAAGRTRREAMRPNRLGRWFVGLIEPPARFRVPVPLPEMVPPSLGDPGTIWADFLQAQSEVVALLEATTDLDLTGIRFRNPLAKNLPLFNLATGFLVMAAHERRHLAQARRVRQEAGFPTT